MSTPFGGRPGAGAVRGLAVLREAVDELRRPSDRTRAARPEPADVRAAVLALLAEQPMSGYQIVRTLEERGGGARTPSAGAVYPALQLLADEGLATAPESAGSRVYSLTDAGRAAAAVGATRPAATASPAASGRLGRASIARAGAQLAQAAAAVAQTGSSADIAEAARVLDEARRTLYSILART